MYIQSITMEYDIKPPRYTQVKNIYNHAGKTIRVIDYKHYTENNEKRYSANSKFFLADAKYCQFCKARCCDPVPRKHVTEKSRASIMREIRYDQE